jgi:rod shape determining protein RodA
MSIEIVDPRARGLRPRRQAESIGLTGAVRRLDWLLVGALAAVAAYGLWAIDGITRHDPGGSSMTRQGMYAGVGLVVFVAVLFVDPDVYRRLRRPIYFGTLGLMLLVLATGAATRGSKRWISLGFFKFQPSEFGKVLFVLVLAGFLADRSRFVGSVRTVGAAIGYAAVPILLVFVLFSRSFMSGIMTGAVKG